MAPERPTVPGPGAAGHDTARLAADDPAAYLDVEVPGGRLAVARYGRGSHPVLGIHGITASSVSLRPVVRHLTPGHTLLAPDLRGRGASNRLPPPYGLPVHAADCARVLEAAAGGEPAVVVGESMGGFVAVLLAAARPDLVERLVLVDGGIPLPVPEGIDPDSLAETVLGPALARLRMTFPSPADYLDFWRAHPALADEWNADIEEYLRYDLEPAGDAFRSRVSEDAVRADSTQTLSEPGLIAEALAGLTCPIRLIRAPWNLSNDPSPLIPDEVVSAWRERLGQLTDEMVPDTNHYTLMFGDTGARIIAACVTEGSPAPADSRG